MNQRAKVTIAVFALLLGVYALLRLGFYLSNLGYFEQASGADIAAAFWYGLRFDIAALIILNLVPLVLYNLPRRSFPRWYLTFVFVLFAMLNAMGVLLNLADYRHYPAVQRRLLHEPWERTGELIDMFPQWYHEYPVLVIGGIAGALIFVFLLYRAVRFLHRRMPGRNTLVRGIISGAILFGLGALGVRGGFHLGFLHPADAFKNSPVFSVGYLTLNSTYTTLSSVVLRPIQLVEKMPEEEARQVVREMLFAADEEPVDPAYPLMRRKRPREEMRNLNVVILIMESWTWANVGPQEGGGTRTPSFDALAAEGLLFTNFLSTGHKSNAAIPSILTSVPSLFRKPVIGSREELTRFRGIGSILKEHGYTTSFHYGIDRTIMGFDAYSRLAGFDHYFCVDDYPDDGGEIGDGCWGIFDELYFLFTVDKLDEFEKPFVAVLFSVSPHDPYKLPSDKEEMFAAHAEETGYQRLLRYSDFALGRFFEKARTRPWFSDTVFLITADHTRFSPPNSYYEAMHIPLLVYAPGIVEPGVSGSTGTQADILPTILDLLHVPTVHASMGRSLLEPEPPHWSVVYREQGFGLFGSEFALVNDLEQDVGLYAYPKDRFFRENLLSRLPHVAADHRRRLFAYLQVITNAVRDDRVWHDQPDVPSTSPSGTRSR